MRTLAPASVSPPLGTYSHGIELEPGKRLVFTAGQVGIGPDGSVPDDAAAQAELCFSNIAAILAEAGMTLSDVVRVNAYVTSPEWIGAYRAARERVFESHRPTATLVIVSGLARPDLKIEVEVVAAA